MKVLIIGGTGFLSSALVAESRERGHEVTIVTRGSANRPAPPDGVTTLHADRADAGALRGALQDRTFDLVIDAILFKPEDARAAVEIFQDRAGCYVFISTDFVYGGEPRRFPLTEEHTPRRAESAYGAKKAACEDVLFAAHAATGFPVVTLRPPHILGAGGLLGTGSREGRDAWLLYKLRNGHPILLLDNGALLIQPVHKRDIARAAFAVALAAPTTLGRAYNMAGPECVTTRRYYEIVCDCLGLPDDTLNVLPLSTSAFLAAYPDRAPHAQNRAYSLDALQRDAGFAPTIGLREAIAEVVADLEAKGPPAGPPPAPDTPLIRALRDQDSLVADALRAADAG